MFIFLLRINVFFNSFFFLLPFSFNVFFLSFNVFFPSFNVFFHSFNVFFLSSKVNVLLQTYISRSKVDGFSLISDMTYITDNSVRITRALFEIVLHKNWPLLAGRLLNMAKMLEKRLWNFQSPMRQFTHLGYEILNKIEDKRLTVEQIREMEPR